MITSESKIIENGESFNTDAAGEELRGKMPAHEKKKLIETLKDSSLRQELALYFATQLYEFWTEDSSQGISPDPFFIASTIGLRSIKTYRTISEVVETGMWIDSTSPAEFYAIQLEAMNKCPLDFPTTAETSAEYRTRRDEALLQAEADLIQRWNRQDA